MLTKMKISKHVQSNTKLWLFVYIQIYMYVCILYKGKNNEY